MNIGWTPGRIEPGTRLAILTEGGFGYHRGKTAVGVVRYASAATVAVVDSTMAGRNVSEWIPGVDVPMVAHLSDALALDERPTALLLGIAPTGGALPAEWREIILEAINAGLDVLSGLHQFLSADPEFAAAAEAMGVRLIDFRRQPESARTATGCGHAPGKRVILTVGTDCAVGKMSVGVELRRAAINAGASAVLVPTGQTGIMIEGWGVAVDRSVADFLQGTCESLVQTGESLADWVIVEGQGSLDHPAYSSVTLGLIHGTTPHAMVMVHKYGLTEHDFDHAPGRSFPIAELRPFVRLHEEVAALVSPSKVVAIALNTSAVAEDSAARQIIQEVERDVGLPCDDPVRFGGDSLWRSIQTATESLPWTSE